MRRTTVDDGFARAMAALIGLASQDESCRCLPCQRLRGFGAILDVKTGTAASVEPHEVRPLPPGRPDARPRLSGAEHAAGSVVLDPEDGAVVVAVHGEADLTLKAQLADTLTRAASTGDAVLVDLCDCAFMDSSGLAAVVEAWRGAEARGTPFVVCCTPGGGPARLMEIAIPGLLDAKVDRAAGLATLRGA